MQNEYQSTLEKILAAHLRSTKLGLQISRILLQNGLNISVTKIEEKNEQPEN